MKKPHLEIKTRYIHAGLAKKIIHKGTVIGVVTTKTISEPAKKLFDNADIAWAENIPESAFMPSELEE
ncbi:MAG: hypothetical protein HC789_16315 [Microcoleus sp. CSU_2_2]|nr:hypothetical protein [Microcoleus sp. SU_5_3]NJS11817.1 hypothetical protein [Microcoleus sp. CSU_2_2]